MSKRILVKQLYKDFCQLADYYDSHLNFFKWYKRSRNTYSLAEQTDPIFYTEEMIIAMVISDCKSLEFLDPYLNEKIYYKIIYQLKTDDLLNLPISDKMTDFLIKLTKNQEAMISSINLDTNNSLSNILHNYSDFAYIIGTIAQNVNCPNKLLHHLEMQLKDVKSVYKDKALEIIRIHPNYSPAQHILSQIMKLIEDSHDE